jgi:hypothetical protein
MSWVFHESLPSLKRVLYLHSDDLRKDSMRALRGMVKTCMPTIIKQILKYELGIS